MAQDPLLQRLKPLGEVKALLEEAVFPVYRTPILNPSPVSSGEVQIFDPDTDAKAPRSFRGFLERMMTFKPESWCVDPNAALYFAKHGWRCTVDLNIHCSKCSASMECSHTVKKNDLWFILAKRAHADLCIFQFLSTPDDLFRLPSDPEVTRAKVVEIFNSLVKLESRLPSLSEEIIGDLGVENKVVELFFEALDQPVSDVGLSALVLGLCGWIKGNSKNTLECSFCQRCVGLWNFFSIDDRMAPVLVEEPMLVSGTLSPKGDSRSLGSEVTPSHEIIPSDCEVPVDSNDIVSEDCSEPSGSEWEGSQDDIADVDSESRGESDDSRYEEDDESVDDEEAGEYSPPIIYSRQLMQRQRTIETAVKRKRIALARYKWGSDDKYGNRRKYVPHFRKNDETETSDVDREDDERSESMDCDGEPEETNGFDPQLCNGLLSSGKRGRSDSECSPSDAECEVIEAVDTLGSKCSVDSPQPKDCSDSSSIPKRHRLDEADNEVNSEDRPINYIEHCTVVNVDDIASKLLQHGVSVVKHVPSGVGSQQPQERGLKRKASSDDEEIELDRSKCPKTEEPTKILETLPSKESSTATDINLKDTPMEDSEISREQSESKFVHVNSVSEVPVELRNGLDSSKANSLESDCDSAVVTPSKIDEAKIDKVNNAEDSIQLMNPDVKENHMETENTPNIPNGGSSPAETDLKQEPTTGDPDTETNCNEAASKQDDKEQHKAGSVLNDENITPSAVSLDCKENHVETNVSQEIETLVLTDEALTEEQGNKLTNNTETSEMAIEEKAQNSDTDKKDGENEMSLQPSVEESESEQINIDATQNEPVPEKCGVDENIELRIDDVKTVEELVDSHDVKTVEELVDSHDVKTVEELVGSSGEDLENNKAEATPSIEPTHDGNNKSEGCKESESIKLDDCKMSEIVIQVEYNADHSEERGETDCDTNETTLNQKPLESDETANATEQEHSVDNMTADIDTNEPSKIEQDNEDEGHRSMQDPNQDEENMEVADITCDIEEETPESEVYVVSESEKNEEDTVSRKRRRSSAEDEVGEEEMHKKPKLVEDPIVKIDFHPVKEHHFWCIYRLGTVSASGAMKPGWEQLKDSLRLSLSMERRKSDEEDMRDWKTFRMRVAEHLAEF